MPGPIKRVSVARITDWQGRTFVKVDPSFFLEDSKPLRVGTDPDPTALSLPYRKDRLTVPMSGFGYDVLFRRPTCE